MAVKKQKRLVLGDTDFNAEWLRNVPEQYAVRVLGKSVGDRNRVRNAWKQANGLTVRNYSKKEETEKKTKKSKKKDSKY